MTEGPCGTWPLDSACLPDNWPADPAQWTPQQRSAVQAATELLWRLTAGRYGLCEETVRPCRRDCTPDGYGTTPLWGAEGMRPVLWEGTWINVVCGCGLGDGCSCSQVCQITLPAPVHQVVTVTVDGRELPADAYTVYEQRKLVRVDGGCWPWCQDLSRPAGEPGTWSVRYLRGREVPAGGRRAVTVLAVEMYKLCPEGGGGRGCRLPGNVIEVEREGLTYRLDPAKFQDLGRTGLPEVDNWLASVNPHRHREPASVYSPDLPSVRWESQGSGALGISWEPL